MLHFNGFARFGGYDIYTSGQLGQFNLCGSGRIGAHDPDNAALNADYGNGFAGLEAFNRQMVGIGDGEADLVGFNLTD